jgi:putative flippase GtrA
MDSTFRYGRFLKFALVGGIGFIADTAVFFLCLHALQVQITVARLIAFAVAVHVTWLGNRCYTFAYRGHSPTVREWQKYMLTACSALLPNLLVFQLVVWILGQGNWSALAALVAGILAGMLWNYYINLRWVFCQHK